MKTFRLIGIALLAIVLCVNFASCSSDDDEIIKDDDGVITNEKKLVEMKETDDDGHTDVMAFSYDSKGKLIAVVQKCSEDNNSDITNITWGENTVKESSDGESITYSINDGLVRVGTETEGYNYSFVYNSSKQLTTYQYGDKYDSGTETLTWENGKVSKIAYDNELSEITYNNQTCKGYFPLMVFVVEDDFKLMLAHPELVGMRTNQLPEQIFSKDTDTNEYYDEYYKETCKTEYTYEDTTKFDYTLDKDGYVESCTVTSTYVNTRKVSFIDKNADGVITDDERDITGTDTGTDITIYSFKWE